MANSLISARRRVCWGDEELDWRSDMAWRRGDSDLCAALRVALYPCNGVLLTAAFPKGLTIEAAA